MSECERAQAQFSDFLDGTLQASDAQEVNTHLQACGLCTREFQALKRTQELLRGITVPEGETSRRRVLMRFRQSVAVEARERKPIPVAWRARLIPMGLAAATMMLMLFPILTFHPNGREHSGMVQPAIRLADASSTETLPTARDLDAMASLHAVQSFTMMDGNEQMQLDALADANSRLHVGSK